MPWVLVVANQREIFLHIVAEFPHSNFGYDGQFLASCHIYYPIIGFYLHCTLFVVQYVMESNGFQSSKIQGSGLPVYWLCGFDNDIDVHVIKTMFLGLNWYIKWYFLGPDSVFISFHH